jgi:hypothetical protein
MLPLARERSANATYDEGMKRDRKVEEDGARAVEKGFHGISPHSGP